MFISMSEFFPVIHCYIHTLYTCSHYYTCVYNIYTYVCIYISVCICIHMCTYSFTYPISIMIYNRNSIGYVIINKLYSIEYSFLCCIKRPCCLSILYCNSSHLLISNSQFFLPPTLLTFGNHFLSVGLFLFHR